MLSRDSHSRNSSVLANDDGTGKYPDLHSILDTDSLNAHTLLLLYLMPEANRSTADAKTMDLVDALSDVHTRLSTLSSQEPSSRDQLALVYSTVSAIRFGTL